jgi:hypothetical protein
VKFTIRAERGVRGSLAVGVMKFIVDLRKEHLFRFRERSVRSISKTRVERLPKSCSRSEPLRYCSIDALSASPGRMSG